MNITEAQEWLSGFQQFGMNLGLKRIHFLMDHLNHPEKNYPIVHVAGTNGKGSVCRFIASILKTAGYRVGVYTSPHLQTVFERFSINDKMISKKDFAEVAAKVKPAVDHLIETGEQPTYFEVCTVMMFHFFALKQVDVAVIEVGLGGRYDATNIVDPLVAVITNVSKDHQQVLGIEIEDIAAEKAGIIKKNRPVVTAATGIALEVIQKKASTLNAPVRVISNENSQFIEKNIQGQQIHCTGWLDSYTVTTSSLGNFQQQNIALAITAVEVLQIQGLYVPEEAIIPGIEHMHHPGRMQILQKEPLVLIDGAHNERAMKVLFESIKDLFSEKKIIMILGLLHDKDIFNITKIIAENADMVIITKPVSHRAENPEIIAEHLRNHQYDKPIKIAADIQQAIHLGLKEAKKTDLILVAGSLYLLAAALESFN